MIVILILVLLLILVLVTVLYALAMYKSKSREAERRAEEELYKAKEERKGLDKEAQGEAEAQRQTEELQKAEEQVRCKADGAQRKEEERQVADEEDRRAEEERKRFEKGKGRKAEEVQLEAEAERKRSEPVKRGGRPRASTEAQERQLAQETKSRRPKPEIICWKKERQWIPAVEIPEELLEKPGLAVLQDDGSPSPLAQDESREGCWRLKGTHGLVVVQWEEDGVARKVPITLGEERYLLFKLSGQDQNQGRLVKSPSSGSYLVMVPDDWERGDTLPGPPPVTPEPVSLPGYQAHFFELEEDGDGKIAFRTPAGEPLVIESKGAQVELVGNQLNDASANKGPLFGEGPPRIRARNEQGWKSIRTIVVGEEGSGRERWRTSFRPDAKGACQDLPPEIAARKAGWYFLRFYDANDDLIESLDFRFICALKEIRISQPSPLPLEDGYRPVCVEFLHEPGCAVQPVDSSTNIQIERQDDKTTLTIPPNPTYDETRWIVGPEGGPQVEVTILVERLWWAIEEEHNAPSEWKDQPLTLSRDDFAATSKKALWLRLPKRRWVDKVFVGFEKPKARSYPVKVADKTVAIPLRDFGDFQEVRGIGITPLKLWICPKGTTPYEGTLCELKIKLRCKFCNFDTFVEEDMLSHVRSLHLRDFFSHLTYEELRDRIPSLPYKIYRCSYCDYYVESGDDMNPTSTIYDHIEQDCPNVTRGKGPVEKKFSIVSDPDEIREIVIHNLQRIHKKCQLCNYVLKNPVESDMMDHLVGSHRNGLYEAY